MHSKIYVWDKFVRLFHWSLVLLVATSYLTGENDVWWHPYSGYLIFILVVLRILWGFVGSRHARFSDFLRGPGTLLTYAKSMLAAKPKHYVGHNPLGGAMVVALLVTLLITTLSGMQLYAAKEDKGPFANTLNRSLELVSLELAPLGIISTAEASGKKRRRGKDKDDDTDEDFWEDVHESAVSVLIVLIVLHLAGVIVSSYLHREALIKAMLTGYKSSPQGNAAQKPEAHDNAN